MLQKWSAMKWSDDADYSTYQLNPRKVHQRFPAVRVQICERSSCCTRPHQSEARTSSYHHHQNQTDRNIPGQQEDCCSCLRWRVPLQWHHGQRNWVVHWGATICKGWEKWKDNRTDGRMDWWMKSVWSKLLLRDWLISLCTIWWTDKETTGPIRKHT